MSKHPHLPSAPRLSASAPSLVPATPPGARRAAARRLAVLLVAAVGLQAGFVPRAFALDCSDLSAAHDNAIASGTQTIQDQQNDMATARQTTADCMTQVSNLMGQYITNGSALGSIGSLLNQKLSTATCATIRQQANQALGQLNSAASQASVPSTVTNTVTSTVGSEVNGALNGSSNTSSTWSSLSNMLSTSK